MELKEKVIKKLGEVIDPGTNMDVINMGLIKNLNTAENGYVAFDFYPSSSVCPLVYTLVIKIQESMISIAEINKLDITVHEHQMADEINKYLKDAKE